MKIIKMKYIVYFLGLFVACQNSFGKVINDIRGTNIPSLSLEEVEVKDALNLLFKSVDAPYSVESNVQGIVTIKAENQPFELVLRSILNQANATYKMVEGNYEISNRKLDFQVPGNALNLNTENTTMPGGKSEPIIRRIKIDFADPQLVWTLLNKINADFKLTPEKTLVSQDISTSTGGGFSSGLGGSMGTRQGFGSYLNK